MNKKIIRYGVILVLFTILYYFLYYIFLPNEKLTYVATVVTSVLPISTPLMIASSTNLSQYIEVISGCNPDFTGDCVNMRSGPGVQYPIVTHLRTGVVLKVGSSTTTRDGVWYSILFSNELLYPERVKSTWYVKADFVQLFSHEGTQTLEKGNVSTTTKRIVVDVSEQKLYAYDKDNLFMEEAISTGLEFTPTPRGTFSVFKMTPSRFMQGPIPGVSDQVYDLPGVPWNLYFTSGGAVIHGAYWHSHFGKPWSHGCVNLSPENAKKLYQWAELGTSVIVKN